jgi:crotonyl-CoA carboxylase/reductase
MNELALQGLLDPCMSKGFVYDDLPLAHQWMHENKHPHGNMAVLVGAKEFGTGITAEGPQPITTYHLPSGDHYAVTTSSTPAPYISQQLDAPEIHFEDDGTLVKDLMNRGLIACAPDDTVGSVASLMVEHRIHAVVVMEAEEAIGVVSQTDVVLARQGRTPEETRQLTARSVMTPGCATCDVNTTLTDAVSTMARLRFHRLVVTERMNGHHVPVGILSMTDVIGKVIAGSE